MGSPVKELTDTGTLTVSATEKTENTMKKRTKNLFILTPP
ncbi:hypothetical protein PHOSAC3_121188 [Mesotoga infera]|nr:hypothetical protein PHOSAC3_121188 [Mesotoga infera]